jgi:hypothetical protein
MFEEQQQQRNFNRQQKVIRNDHILKVKMSTNKNLYRKKNVVKH